MHRHRSLSIAIIGAGTRGVSLVERIGASATELLPGQQLDLYLVDPYPAGPGRVWRYDQPSVLQANSIAGMLTMFTDSSVVCEGPILPGPSLTEWADLVRVGVHAAPDDPELADELAALGEWSYASRRLVSAYLAWAFHEIRTRLPANIMLHVIEDKAVDVADSAAAGQQRVELASAGELVVDAVILAVGHLDAVSAAREAALQDFATRQNLFYVPPAYSADVDLDPIQPGETVIIRGLGLAFIDFTAMLTEGRGGSFRELADGRLDYVPSGQEPVIVAGSRRGVPHHGKPNYRLTSSPPTLPRFLDAAELASCENLDFTSDVASLVAKEVAWAYYHELVQQRCEQAAFEDFAERFAAASWESPEMELLLAEVVPDVRDRFDFEALTGPLGGQRHDSEHLQARLREYIKKDVSRRLNPKHGADLRVISGVESVLEQLTTDAVLSRLHPRDVRTEIDGQLASLAKKVGSGPPAARLHQLIALSEAGVVRFLGAGIWAEADEVGGVFRAGSISSSEVIEARSLIEARLPDATVSRSASPLLRALSSRGETAEQVLLTPGGESYARGKLLVNALDGRMVSAAGVSHPRRYALGSYTTSGAEAAFIFPNRNSLILRQNDVVARQLLKDLAEQSSTPDRATPRMVES